MTKEESRSGWPKALIEAIGVKCRMALTFLLYGFRLKSIGPKCLFGRPILVSNLRYVTVGSSVTIRRNFRIECVDRRLGVVFSPALTIGSNVNIEQNFHLTCAKSIIIEDFVSISANVAIFDIVHPYDDVTVPIKEQKYITKAVRIGFGTFIGFGAVILPGVDVGCHCVVGANSVVTRSVADYTIVGGSPARVIRRYDFLTKKWEKG